MIDFYANTDPRYRSHIKRAHDLRSAAYAAAFRALWSGPSRVLQRVLNRIQLARARSKARAELRGLPDGALKDIGVARCEIGSIVDSAVWGRPTS